MKVGARQATNPELLWRLLNSSSKNERVWYPTCCLLLQWRRLMIRLVNPQRSP